MEITLRGGEYSLSGKIALISGKDLVLSQENLLGGGESAENPSKREGTLQWQAIH